jgi:hypothetical protein
MGAVTIPQLRAILICTGQLQTFHPSLLTLFKHLSMPLASLNALLTTLISKYTVKNHHSLQPKLLTSIIVHITPSLTLQVAIHIMVLRSVMILPYVTYSI